MEVRVVWGNNNGGGGVINGSGGSNGGTVGNGTGGVVALEVAVGVVALPVMDGARLSP